MEIRDLLSAIQRRWRIVAFVTLLALVVGGFFTLRGPLAWESTIRLAVSTGADTRADAPPYVYYRDYYAWLASEYLADDITEVIKSDAFLSDVAAHLNEPLTGSSIRHALRAKKTHRIVDVTVQAPTADQARRIAGAIAEVIRTQGSKYLRQLATANSQIAVIDGPDTLPATTTPSQALDIGLRGALGLLAGLFLAWIVDYIDSTLRTSADVQRALGLPILGEIPER